MYEKNKYKENKKVAVDDNILITMKKNRLWVAFLMTAQNACPFTTLLHPFFFNIKDWLIYLFTDQFICIFIYLFIFLLISVIYYFTI